MKRHFCLLSAGSNSGGQLGVGHREDAHCWTPARRQQEQHLTSNAHAVSFSCSSSSLSRPSFPPPGTRIRKLASGANHSIALLAQIEDQDDSQYNDLAFSVWYTGESAQGQVGQAALESADGSTSEWRPLQLEFELNIAGRATPQAIAKAATATAGYLPVDVACSWNASFVVLRSAGSSSDPIPDSPTDTILALGRVKDNPFGELGLSIQPKQSSIDELAAHFVPLSGLADERSDATRLCVRQIAAGLRHLVVLATAKTSDAEHMHLIGWGAARQGQLGHVPTRQDLPGQGSAKSTWRAGKVTASSARLSPPTILQSWMRKDTHNFFDVPGPLQPHHSFSLAAGREHTVVSVPEGWQDMSGSDSTSDAAQFNSWGSNRRGQRDLENAKNIKSASLSVAATWDSTFLVCTGIEPCGQSQILACGSNARGQLGSGLEEACPEENPRNAMRIIHPVALPQHLNCSAPSRCTLAAGSEHALLLYDPRTSLVGQSDPAEVWGWGWNEHGNLALGEIGPRDSQCRAVQEKALALEQEGEDQRAPVQIWPAQVPNGANGASGASPAWKEGKATDVWAGCGSSFLQVSMQVI